MRGYGRTGTRNDRLEEAVILNTGTPTTAHKTCRRRRRYRAAGLPLGPDEVTADPAVAMLHHASALTLLRPVSFCNALVMLSYYSHNPLRLLS